jgi:hypothetical protein
MSRMKTAVVARARCVVDACSWDSDGAGDTSAPKSQMGPVHP